MSEQLLHLNLDENTSLTHQPVNGQLRMRRSRLDMPDYETAVAIENANYPDLPQDAENWRHWDSQREEKYLYRRYLAELGDQVVATGEIGHTSWSYQPGKFYIYVAVDPDLQQRGIGSAFYEYLLQELAPFEPAKLVTNARENHTQSFRFLENRGFQSMLRAPTSVLQVDAFDPEPFRPKVERALQSGITVKTLAQLRDEDPDWKRKLYDLEWECLLDVPTTDPLTRRTIEQWEKMFNSPNLLSDAWFIAVEGDQYVGLSVLWRNAGNPRLLETGLTGVLRSYRRRSIATAMKLQAIEYARQYGAQEIVTDNEENNPMFQLNLQLGFMPTPAFHEFQKELLPAL